MPLQNSNLFIFSLFIMAIIDLVGTVYSIGQSRRSSRSENDIIANISKNKTTLFGFNKESPPSKSKENEKENFFILILVLSLRQALSAFSFWHMHCARTWFAFVGSKTQAVSLIIYYSQLDCCNPQNVLRDQKGPKERSTQFSLTFRLNYKWRDLT